MFRRGFALFLLALLFLPLPIQSSGDACPLGLDAASRMIPSDCYANASASAAAMTGCCWYVFAGYLLAASRHANLTGEAFMPPAVAAACSSFYSDLLLRRGLVSPSLLTNNSCDLSTSNLAADGGPCQFPTVSAVRSATDLSNATLLCASPSAGNLSKDTGAGGACQTCQDAVIAGTLALLNATQTKEFVPCGMAATIGVWAPYYPSLPRFRSYALCMLQVLENVGGLGTSNLIPSPPPPPSPAKPPDVATGVPSTGASTSKTIKVAAASAAAGLLSVVAIVYLAFKIRHSTVSPALSGEQLESSLKSSSPIPSSPLPTDGLYIFTKAELRTATNSYDARLLLGTGGAGKVYLGRLPSGQCVAIKRIYREKKLAEFYSEVTILAKLRHPNLTTLVGYCLTTGGRVIGEREYALVYEYMAGGNLARALFDGDGIPWPRRVQIAADVAQGLVYLHDFPGGAVVHRDVKPTNVLLTAVDAGAAKLSDFGVSRVVSADGTHVSTEVMGTMGYVDPESFAVGHVSEATDVYSFGVVLLELVTGRRAVMPTPTGGSESLVQTARAATEALDGGGEGDLGAIVDPRLGPGWDRGTVTAVFVFACRCVRPHKVERPRMVEAVAVLRAALLELEAPTGTSTSASEEVTWGEVDSSPVALFPPQHPN